MRTSTPITVGRTTDIHLEGAGRWPRLTHMLLGLGPGWPSGSRIISHVIVGWLFFCFFFQAEKLPLNPELDRTLVRAEEKGGIVEYTTFLLCTQGSAWGMAE